MQKKWGFALVCALCLTSCSLQDVDVHGDHCPASHSVMVDGAGYLVTENGYQLKADEQGFYYAAPEFVYCDEEGKSLADEDSNVKEEDKVKADATKNYVEWSTYYEMITSKLQKQHNDEKEAISQYKALRADFMQLKFIYLTDDTFCSRESTLKKCSEFALAFKYNNCPENYNRCGFSTSKGYYCKSEDMTCKKGEHWDDDIKDCMTDDVDNCGETGNACSNVIANWKRGECVEGKCVVDECVEEFKPKDGACVADCPVGKHYDSEAAGCVEDDINHCSSVNNNCEMLAGWLSGSCEKGVCVATGCKSGYLLTETQCTAGCSEGQHSLVGGGCEPDTVDHCGSHDTSCSSAMPGWGEGECVQGACVASICSESYHLKDGWCEKNTNVCCGMNEGECIDCTLTKEICSGTACVTSCGPGTEKCDNGCVNIETDLDNCGGCGVVCSTSEDKLGGSAAVSSVKCERRVCVVDKCNNGYTLMDGVCEKTGCLKNEDCSVVNGTGVGVCNSSNQCEVVCNSGYALNSEGECTKIGCLKDSDCSVANATAFCNSSFKCDFTCNAGYTLSSGKCVKIECLKDSDCSVANATAFCNSSFVCDFTCNAGYTPSGSTCVKTGCISDSECLTENGTGVCNSQFKCHYICDDGFDESDEGCIAVAE